jgi:hypothetical protein
MNSQKMNPQEIIENDKMLTAILKGLTDMWHFQEEFLALIVFITRDFDIANNTVEYFADEDIGLEEALFQSMELDMYRTTCLTSEYLDNDKCKQLLDESEN